MISSTYDACKKKGWYNENQKKKKNQISFFKITKYRGIHEILTKTKSLNSGDHEFWNHEMRGPPVVRIHVSLGCKIVHGKNRKRFGQSLHL